MNSVVATGSFTRADVGERDVEENQSGSYTFQGSAENDHRTLSLSLSDSFTRTSTVIDHSEGEAGDSDFGGLRTLTMTITHDEDKTGALTHSPGGFTDDTGYVLHETISLNAKANGTNNGYAETYSGTVLVTVDDANMPGNNDYTSSFREWSSYSHAPSGPVESLETISTNQRASASETNPSEEAGLIPWWAHVGLDLAGFIPVVGEPIDLLHAGIYLMEGNVLEAGLSAGSAVLPVAGDAIFKGGKYAFKAIKLADAVRGTGKLALGSSRAAGALADGMKAGKQLVSRGVGKAADQALHAGRSVGLRVPVTKCNIPIANRAFNWCFVPDTLVIVSGETVDEVRADNDVPLEEPNVALAGWLPSSEIAVGVCVALAVGAAASGVQHGSDEEPRQLPTRRRRQPAPREYDLLHARLLDEDFAAEETMDEELLRAIALEQALEVFDPCAALHDAPGETASVARASAAIAARPRRSRKPNAKPGIRFDSPTLRAEQESADRAAIDRFTAARRLRRMSVVALLLAAVACWFGIPALRHAETPVAPLTLANNERAASTRAATPSALPAKRIEDIQLGDRLAGTNPLREQAELIEPDEETWREVQLVLTKEDGELLWVKLLRPLAWLDTQEVSAVGTIFLDMPEMGAVGDADVLTVLPCPKIDAGDGAVVTGIFRHEVTGGEIVELRLEEKPATTRVTANHPYWSVDRQDFIPAGQLQVGERLSTLAGPVRIAAATRAPYAGPLYNLETTEHVYCVGSDGALVHNACAGQHHMWPKSWGNGIPYQHKTLRYYSEVNHTLVHNAFSQFLRNRTGLAFGSQRGERWMRDFGRHGLGRLVHEFHRQFSQTPQGIALARRIAPNTGLTMYDLFKAEYQYILRKNLFKGF